MNNKSTDDRPLENNGTRDQDQSTTSKSADDSAEPRELESEIEENVADLSDPADEAALEIELDAGMAEQLEQAQEEIVKLKDAYLRAKAEEQNVRQRSEKEIENRRKFAIEGFAKELLNVRDSLKLAAATELPEDAGESLTSIQQGVEITLKQLNTAFEKFDLLEIVPSPGDKVDPNLHQAMSMVEAEDIDSGCIVNIIQDGFQLHQRLLRPALVTVAK